MIVSEQDRGRWLGNRGLLLSEDLVEQVLPFAIILEFDTIRYAGPSLTTCIGKGSLLGRPLKSVLQMVEPEEAITQEISDWDNLIDRPLLLEAHRGTGQNSREVTFAGQIKPLQRNYWLVELAPLQESLHELHEYGLTLQDLPIHDPFRQTFVSRLMAEGMQEVLAKKEIDDEHSEKDSADLTDLLALLPRDKEKN